MSMKNPLTVAGIEAVIFRFVAQHLNHYTRYIANKIKTAFLFFYKFSSCGFRYL